MDNPGVPPQSPDRLGIWLSVLVGSFVLGLALEVPWWIPEWQGYVDALVVGLTLVALAASVATFNAARKRVRRSVPPRWRWPAYAFLTGATFAVWSLGALIAVLSISGGPFGASYDKQFHFAEFEATVYLYDSSFIDPETTVYVRRGWLPWRGRVLHLGRHPDDVDVVLRGDVVMIGDQALDLKNRTE